MIHALTLSCALLTTPASVIHAPNGLAQLRHDVVLAAERVKTRGDLQLRGAVSKMTERGTNEAYRQSYEFDERGILLSREGTSPGGPRTREVYSFTDGGVLMTIVTEDSTVRRETFDATGALVSARVQHQRGGSTDDQGWTETYLVSPDRTHVSMRIAYETDPLPYEVMSRWDTTITYDAAGRVASELETNATNTGTRYRRRRTCTYDGDSRRPTTIAVVDLVDPGEGVNSMLNLTVTNEYDALGRIVRSQTVDRTVRNDVWSHSSWFAARYNDAGDVVELTGSAGRPPSRFEYTYDAHGNWTTMTQRLDGAEKTVVMRRTITYFGQ
ncbi:MAG: hypothetical protein JNG84_13680 [Archangium sp.]|nr:hypothetical protein [Archangium sp.]